MSQPRLVSRWGIHLLPTAPPLYRTNKAISMEPESAGEECTIISWGCDSFHRWRFSLIEAVIISVRTDLLLLDKLVTKARDESSPQESHVPCIFECCYYAGARGPWVHVQTWSMKRCIVEAVRFRDLIIGQTDIWCTPAAAAVVLPSILSLELRISTWCWGLRIGWFIKIWVFLWTSFYHSLQ